MTNSRKITDFTELNAWKKSHDVVLKTYTASKRFPDDERFGLTSQMRRAAVSVTSNIAEGFGRASAKEKKHFYSIAKGSLLELRSQYYVARDLKYIEHEELVKVKENIIEAEKLISGIMKSAPDRTNT